MKISKLFNGAVLVGCSQILVAASTFFRNIILARLLSVEDFGTATTFALTLSLVEMTSNLSFDKILVQDRDGASHNMLGSAHFLQFVKSLITSALIFLSAPLIAKLFNLQELTWAYQLLAITPLIKGFNHLDPVTFNRTYRFGPTSALEAIPQLVALMSVYPLAIYLEDYRVVIAISFLIPFSQVLISHYYAERPYRWVIQKDLILKKLNFGWPLLLNGLLLFLVFNGDKTIVGSSYGMETLGWFSAAFALTMMPTVLLAKIFSTLALPYLSRTVDDRALFLNYSTITTSVCMSAALFTWTFFHFGGRSLIELCYGDRYLSGASIISSLALMQIFRVARVGVTLVALSQADTRNALYANIVRSASLPIAIAFAYLQLPLSYLLYAGIAGEFFACITAIGLLRFPHDVKALYVKNISVTFAGLIISVIVILLAFPVGTADSAHTGSPILTILGAVAISFFCMIVSLAMDHSIRTWVVTTASSYKQKLN